jgi:hypothetical protein
VCCWPAGYHLQIMPFQLTLLSASANQFGAHIQCKLEQYVVLMDCALHLVCFCSYQPAPAKFCNCKPAASIHAAVLSQNTIVTWCDQKGAQARDHPPPHVMTRGYAVPHRILAAHLNFPILCCSCCISPVAPGPVRCWQLQLQQQHHLAAQQASCWPTNHNRHQHRSRHAHMGCQRAARGVACSCCRSSRRCVSGCVADCCWLFTCQVSVVVVLVVVSWPHWEGGEQMCCNYLLALHLSVEHAGLLSAALKTAADVSDACMPHDTTLVPILGFLGKGMSPIAPHRLPQARKHASCLCILWLLACADHIGGISQASAFTQCEVRTSAKKRTQRRSLHSVLCSCGKAAVSARHNELFSVVLTLLL